MRHFWLKWVCFWFRMSEIKFPSDLSKICSRIRSQNWSTHSNNIAWNLSYLNPVFCINFSKIYRDRLNKNNWSFTWYLIRFQTQTVPKNWQIWPSLLWMPYLILHKPPWNLQSYCFQKKRFQRILLRSSINYFQDLKRFLL